MMEHNIRRMAHVEAEEARRKLEHMLWEEDPPGDLYATTIRLAQMGEALLKLTAAVQILIDGTP